MVASALSLRTAQLPSLRGLRGIKAFFRGAEATWEACEETSWARVISENVFVSQDRVSGFPEKGADLRGSPRKFRRNSENSEEFWETSGEPLDCC